VPSSQARNSSRVIRLVAGSAINRQPFFTTFDCGSLSEPAGAAKPVGRATAALDTPLSPFIARFIGSPPINMSNGAASDGVMCVGSIAFPFEGAPGAVTVGLRPEYPRFTGSGLSGRVAQLEPMGREILYVVDTVPDICGSSNTARSRPIPVGESVRIGFSPVDSLVFDAASQMLRAAARVGSPTRSAGKATRADVDPRETPGAAFRVTPERVKRSTERPGKRPKRCPFASLWRSGGCGNVSRRLLHQRSAALIMADSLKAPQRAVSDHANWRCELS
jgi:hypothetical protein